MARWLFRILISFAAAGAFIFASEADAQQKNERRCDGIIGIDAVEACLKGHSYKREADSNPRGDVVTSDMRDYRDRLDKAFLTSGISVQIFVATTKSKTGLKHDLYPALTLFGYIDRVFVYKAATTASIIKDAKSAGFRAVEFYGKDGGGRWVFDLRKPQTTCSVDLCFPTE